MLLIEKILSLIQSMNHSSLLLKARRSVDDGHVLQTRLSDGFFMARVKDDQGQIFTSHSDLKQWSEKNYKCLCTSSMPCVHIVSGLMSWLDNHLGAQKKPKNGYASVNWLKDDTSSQASHWHADWSGDTENGFQYQLSIEQQDEQWNLIDIVVYLLENYTYANLMTKDDQMMFEMTHANGHVLRVAWWRIKWFLQRIVESNLQIKSSKLMLQSDWRIIKKLQQWTSSIADSDNIWHSNQAWENMSWLLEPELMTLEACHSPSLQCQLRPYQLEGVRWLRSLHRSGFGGILADDMGLGKTIQMLAYLSSLKDAKLLESPALLVVPTSLLTNWQDECNQFTPQLQMQIYHGKSKLPALWEKADIVITSYGMVQRHATIFKKFNFSHIILDEGQLIKNFQSQKSQVLKGLEGKIRFCLTGTPMENHLGELWSLIDFVVPQLLGSRSQFRKSFQTPIEVNQNQEIHQDLLARIQPFILRRSKQQVLKNLPEKTRIVQKLNLEGDQFELYETLRCLLADRVQMALAEKGLVNSRWVVLDALLKLRQICCHPLLLPGNWNPESCAESAKLKHLMEMLDNIMVEGRSVLIFSQFTKMLHLIELQLQEKNYPYQVLTGKTQKRDVLVKRFQQGEVPIFLLSLRAGGLGLNLTKADTVIHYEPWWNPAVSSQATDRIYRIGQEQPVFEYHLIAKGTVEESMLELQTRKHALFDQTIDAAGNMQMMWTEENIMKFFAPLS